MSTGTEKGPLPNGPNGRDTGGRFTKGNPGGPGNPYARQTAKLRSAMLEIVTEEDIKAVVGKLVEKAKGGDVQAVKELLDRCLGKPAQAVEHTGPERQPIEIVMFGGK